MTRAAFRWTAAAGLAVALVSIGSTAMPRAEQAVWKPSAGPLLTRWAKDVTPDRVLPDYPRPQMVRSQWLNLNGLWDYAIVDRRSDVVPASGMFDGKILVPFPIESALSGVMKKVGDSNKVWYRRTFEVPREWQGQRVLLHFGAVDFQAWPMVNGQSFPAHQGGYDAFTLDITQALKPDGPQTLMVSVWDPTDAGQQPRGKQVNRPNGIWYTSVTGIWQTVWIEPVPETSINWLLLTPDIDQGVLNLRMSAEQPDMERPDAITAIALDGAREVARATGRVGGSGLNLAIRNAKLWSPDSPFLYSLKVSLTNGRATDTVTSYFGMRKSSLCTDAEGTTRMCLNNAPLFQAGPLDQGWWPDGLYTAPTDEALRYDIDVMKRLGFNMARKHVKVEPERWYYWADRLGLIVWQDMPSTVIRANTTRTPESAAQFERELDALIDQRRNHPSIVMWVPFNEGWGQYDTPRIVDAVRTRDPSRLVDNASGWTDAKVGDVSDVHRYPGPGVPPKEAARAAVLGEFGGLGLPLPGHTWQEQANWSYRGFTSQTELTNAFVSLLGRLHPLIGTPGLSAAVYTQTTDVEIEVNGLMTYDRAVIKPDEARARAAILALYTPPPTMREVLATSRDQPATWRYTTNAPAADWTTAAFDDSTWASGPG
ncbi:MAG TPA: glycoside hydrolase family 2 TIM barrel-domain containing protein, partial [Vicinamibacterales bacterium]|nr:glycoside hydrolase family 2 TIM barrel-domain containing protein [Vicinamibacterales bacterium]